MLTVTTKMPTLITEQFMTTTHTISMLLSNQILEPDLKSGCVCVFDVLSIESAYSFIYFSSPIYLEICTAKEYRS